ncbi:MAG: heme ABC transporter ATP-binding protein, partial [Bacillota bacterium]
GYIPADRQREGLVLDMSVEENIILKSTYAPEIVNHGFLNKKKISELARNKIENFNIVTPSKETAVRSLSGGNQQKVVISREISIGDKFLIAVQPTRGLDFGAANYVRESLIEERDKGKAILLISNELSEILELSDRIGVIYEGEIMDEFSKEEADVSEIGYLMTGIRGEQVE